MGKWHWYVEGRFMTYRHYTEQISQGKWYLRIHDRGLDPPRSKIPPSSKSGGS